MWTKLEYDKFTTSPFTILEPHKKVVGEFLCSSGKSGDGFGSSKLVKGSVGKALYWEIKRNGSKSKKIGRARRAY